MTKRLKRKKSEDGTCAHCGRKTGERSKPKCSRCPGQKISASMHVHPYEGVRLLVVDPSTVKCGVCVTSPTQPYKLEHAWTIDPFTIDPHTICEKVVADSVGDGAPCWLIVEDPGFGGPRARPDVILGIGQAIGVWRAAWIIAGGGDTRVLLVRQVVWVAGVMPHLTQAKGIERKAGSMEKAPLLWGRETIGSPIPPVQALPPAEIEWTEDLADAGMLANFVLRWPEFIDQIGIRDRADAEDVVEGT